MNDSVFDGSLTDAMRVIEMRNLRVERNQVGDWCVGDHDLKRWNKTLVAALSDYLRAQAQKGKA
jgi:hypothetical protein